MAKNDKVMIESPYTDDELAEEEAGAGAEKADRAVFDRIAKKSKGARTAPREEFKSELEDDDDDEPEVDEPEESEDDEPETDEDDDEDEKPKEKTAADKARKALKLRKVKGDVVDRLSDEDAEAIWSGISDREAEVDRLLEQQAKARKQHGEATGEGEHATPTSKQDLDSVFARAVEAGADEEVLAPMRTILKQQQETVDRLIAERSLEQRQVKSRALRESLERVGEQFPGLKDDKTRERVLARMKALGTTDEFANGDLGAGLDELTRAAALSLDLSSEEGDPKTEAAFSPSTRKVTKKPSRNLSPAKAAREADRRAFNHIRRKPGDIAGARKAAGYSN